MSPRKPRNVIAVTPGGDLTLDHILGWYVVSSIPDAGVSEAKVRRAWIKIGVDANLIPKNRKAVHTFQLACRSVETRRSDTGATNGALKQVEVRVDEVLENQAECVYQVTHLIRDKDNKVIEHPKAMRVIFDKDKQEIRWEPLDELVMDNEHLTALGQSIVDNYEANSNKVPGSKVREAIRRTLESLHGTTIAKGKLWFVPKAGRNTLEELEETLQDLYANQQYEFHTIPVASDKGQKALIEKHLTANVREECNRLLVDITTRLKEDKGMRSDKMANLVNRRREISKLIEKYRNVLDTSLAEVDEQVLLLNEGIDKLIERTGVSA